MVRSSTILGKVYRFKHNEDFTYPSRITGVTFDEQNAYLRVEPDGKITVKGSKQSVLNGETVFRNDQPLQGYAWDGCSPKINWLDITWGTPDGKMNFDTEKPKTYFASMVHDAIYQYKGKMDIRRIDADKLFRQMARDEKFMLAGIYYFFIRLFGGIYGKWKKK